MMHLDKSDLHAVLKDVVTRILDKKYYFIAFYFIVLLMLAPINLPLLDTYYYWDWSRHLGLSYFDGPPLIAYVIRLSTLVFGNTLFALAFVGIAMTALTSRILYKTARFFLNEEASFITIVLWVFSPLVTMDLLKQTTYDTPLTLFWALTIYYVAKYIKTNKNSDLYYIGFSLGLLMLSKYSGAVLVLALIIFIVITPYRSLLKNKHFYFSMIVPALMFSPVLYWNYQHEWQSFAYQLTTHQAKIVGQPLVNVFKAFFLIYLPLLNFMMLPPLFCWLKSGKYVDLNKSASYSFLKDVATRMKAASRAWMPDPERKNRTHFYSNPHTYLISLFLVIGTTFFCFYLFMAISADVRACWLSQYLITSALLAGYCFQTFHYRRVFYVLVAAYVAISFIILLDGCFHFTPSKGVEQYESIQQLNRRYPNLPKTVLTTGWFQARPLFFLKDKPLVYTIACDSPQNQYELWSADMVQKIKNKQINNILYIDTYDRVACVKPYFDQCQALPIDDPSKKEHAMFAYVCSNKIKKMTGRSI